MKTEISSGRNSFRKTFFFLQIITIRNKTMYIHLYDDASGKMVEWRPSIKKKLKRNKDGWAKLSSTKCLFHVQMVSLSIREIRPSPPPTSSSLTCHPIAILAIDELNVKKMAKILLFFLPRISCYQIILIVYRCYCFLPLSY